MSRDISSAQCLVPDPRAPPGSCWFVLVFTPLTTAISPFYPAPYKDFGAEMWNQARVAFDFTHDTGSTGTAHVVTLVSPTPCPQQDSPTQERRAHLLAQLAQRTKRTHRPAQTRTAGTLRSERTHQATWANAQQQLTCQHTQSRTENVPPPTRLQKRLGNHAGNHLPGHGTQHKCRASSSAKAQPTAATETGGETTGF